MVTDGIGGHVASRQARLTKTAEVDRNRHFDLPCFPTLGVVHRHVQVRAALQRKREDFLWKGPAPEI